MIRPLHSESPQPADVAVVATSSYFIGMRVVGIKVLKNKLSEYVKLAASGETVLVTDRDRVVAELVPPRADRRADPEDAIIAQGVREGWITPATITDGSPPPRGDLRLTLEQILDDQARDREDR